MIAMPPKDGPMTVITALMQARGKAFLVKTGCDGVRVEA